MDWNECQGLAALSTYAWPMPMSTNHAQVQVLSPFGIIEVDAGIVRPLECVWAFGAHTEFSCEGGPPNMPEVMESHARKGESWESVGYIVMSTRSHMQELLARLIGAGVAVSALALIPLHQCQVSA
jgi:hypothetical protein